VTDPLGGINTLWPLFGMANQMLAAIALTFATVCLVKMKKQRYVLVTALPTAWLVTCTLTTGWLKLFDADPRIGFLAHAKKFGDAIASGQVLAPAKSLEEMARVVRNDHIDAALTVLLMALVVALVTLGAKAALKAWKHGDVSTRETPYVAA
jgi:carbon starvation protein